MKNKIVTREEWRKRRIALLEKEKEFTRLRDEHYEQVRALPWVKIDKDYRFQTPEGEQNLGDLFGDNSQLVVYHFMYGPNDKNPCKSCSFWADNLDRLVPHLNQRDVTMLCISRGELEKLQVFKKRMGWNFKWVSSYGSDFNFDFHVSFEGGETGEYNYREYAPEQSKERPGISVFYKDEEDNIYHTYSCYSRGLESFNNAYRYLDIAPKGRDEDELPWPMAWVRYHDEY